MLGLPAGCGPGSMGEGGEWGCLGKGALGDEAGRGGGGGFSGTTGEGGMRNLLAWRGGWPAAPVAVQAERVRGKWRGPCGHPRYECLAVDA